MPGYGDPFHRRFSAPGRIDHMFSLGCCQPTKRGSGHEGRIDMRVTHRRPC